MDFNKHFDLEGKHAFLSASKHHWINYDDDKLDLTFRNALAAQQGTILHEFAAQAIKLGIKLPRNKQTINMYVNDAIGFRMTPEQVLFYSYNAFGTADAISFRKNVLRIHDLKTGVGKCSFHQLEIYVAFFCLEYRVKPTEIEVELRIYQNDDVQTFTPDPDEILAIMEKIVSFDKRVDALKMEVMA